MRAYIITSIILQKNIVTIFHERGMAKIVAENRKQAKMILNTLKHVPLDVFL